MALDRLLDLFVHRLLCFSSTSFCFSYSYVRQAKLTSSLVNFRAHEKNSDWLIDWYYCICMCCYQRMVKIQIFVIIGAPIRPVSGRAPAASTSRSRLGGRCIYVVGFYEGLRATGCCGAFVVVEPNAGTVDHTLFQYCTARGVAVQFLCRRSAARNMCRS